MATIVKSESVNEVGKGRPRKYSHPEIDKINVFESVLLGKHSPRTQAAAWCVITWLYRHGSNKKFKVGKDDKGNLFVSRTI